VVDPAGAGVPSPAAGIRSGAVPTSGEACWGSITGAGEDPAAEVAEAGASDLNGGVLSLGVGMKPVPVRRSPSETKVVEGRLGWEPVSAALCVDGRAPTNGVVGADGTGEPSSGISAIRSKRDA
jgi:hypothetical protein